MKIGLVTGEFPPMEGGVGAFTLELAQGLNKTGNQVHVITSRQARPKVQDRSLWDVREPYDLGYAQIHARIGRWWWSAMGTVADIVARYELDIINIQYQAAAYDMVVPAIYFLPWRLRDMTKTVVTFHDLRVPYLFPKAGFLRDRVVLQLARSADAAIVTNEEDNRVLIERGLSDKPVEQIPIGSNIQVYKPAGSEIRALRRELANREDCYLLGYFGFLNRSKGADTLLQTLALLPERYELVFIGGKTGASDSSRNREFLENVESLIDELGIQERVHWSGFLEQPDVSMHFYATDTMVLPYRDGASLRRGTLMAVLAHGRPLITTIPATPVESLIHGRNVWMTPVDDPEALRDAIVVMADDQEFRMKIGKKAEETAAQFSWEKITAQTASFFEQIARTNA